jgi:hypothetical protein
MTRKGKVTNDLSGRPFALVCVRPNVQSLALLNRFGVLHQASLRSSRNMMTYADSLHADQDLLLLLTITHPRAQGHYFFERRIYE